MTTPTQHIVYWIQHESEDSEWHAWRSDEEQALCGFSSSVGIDGPTTTFPELYPTCSECRRLTGHDEPEEPETIDAIELLIDIRRMLFEASHASTEADGSELRVIDAATVTDVIDDIDTFLKQEGIEVTESAENNDKDRS